ncbi:TetR/AcrR family transcriptional regulator [Agrobacterium rubi]|uniref:TetR/AcrR family transcriptional regulator n=1 Tax=Agrobacterium rubi TaxID=28099 RepID=A0AAE7R8R6_9HYPH|nr:TetR/AcrR family transcriptional regulator [Agrobacterium rubi]NTE87832.1 TetR/AcrR family transcriptional regulator [Agrobacterium rubi]NTF05170.1 TetR/AcrR family transcriptional regulator [Agrobacterium rubi]NTF37925.1 TetR/AcrR family transcriptional regulator [Agrobacterium rubi]OCJ54176.1 TetR family transcriptional regulator [Agrobacterium rubi]QTG01787.1 TetR/AcrR family transcriptional regulator [Agrobacterium rubi]
MRVSRAQAEENRDRVIDVASRLFREHGFDGIGLKDLMKGAGLTQGAFYKQFTSKDDLAALASARAMESATMRWSEAAANSSDPLEAVMDFYLSTDHREEKAEGCPLVALGSDAARQNAEVKQPFEDGILAHFEVLENLMGGGEELEARNKAMAILSLMVGAVMLSRLTQDEPLSQGILESVAGEVRRIAGRVNTP